MKTSTLIIHSIFYNLAWLAAILLAAQNEGAYATLVILTTVTLQTLWQYTVAKQTTGLWLFMLLFLILGTAVDTTLMNAGIIQFPGNTFGNHVSPPWMSALWLSFSITFYSTLQYLFERYLVVAMLSFFAFPIAYSLGVRLGAANFPHGYMSSMIVGIIWAALFPFTLWLYKNISIKF